MGPAAPPTPPKCKIEVPSRNCPPPRSLTPCPILPLSGFVRPCGYAGRVARNTTNYQLREALRGASSVAEAARAAGCSRALIYQRAAEDGGVAAELDRIRANRGSSERSRRRHRQRDREVLAEAGPQPGSVEDDGPSPTPSSPEVRPESLRDLALRTLCVVAAKGGKGDAPRVAAARELLRYAEALAVRDRASERDDDEGAQTINLEAARAELLARLGAM